MRQPAMRVRLGGRTVTSFAPRGGQRSLSQNTPAASAARNSGLARVQLVNPANIAAYVVARIVWCNYPDKHSEIPTLSDA